VINITINSFGTELQKEDRGALFPNFGLLYPEGSVSWISLFLIPLLLGGIMRCSQPIA
jgi:hypothetical protein